MQPGGTRTESHAGQRLSLTTESFCNFCVSV